MKKLTKCAICILLGLTMSAGLAACGTQSNTDDGNTPATSVSYNYTLNKTTIELEKGETDVLTVEVSPEKEITPVYESEDIAVATVSQDGTVTAAGAGETVIRVSVDGETLTCNVTVTETVPPIEYRYTLNKTTIELEKGETDVLTVEVSPEKEITPVFESEDIAVATVSQDGTVTAAGAGETVIRVSVDGETLTCNVTVTETVPPIEYRYTLNKTTIELEKGETDVLTVEVSPEKEITPVYESEDIAVATVTQDGTVTAAGAGETVIRVSVDGETLTCNVTVTETVPPIEYRYTLNKTAVELEKGETDVLTVEVSPEKEITPVYESEDIAVATVTQDGTVTAAGAGETVIRVSVDGETLTCNVTVTDYTPTIDLSETALNGLSGETVGIHPVITYDGDKDFGVEVGVTLDGTDIDVDGSYEEGNLSFVPLGAGTYRVCIKVRVFGKEPVEETYDVQVVSLGALEQTDAEGLRYVSENATDKNASNTMAYVEAIAAGNTEIKFNIGNKSLNWNEESEYPLPSNNTDFMAVMVIFARADGKYDLVAIDFSTAKLLVSANISEATSDLSKGYITLRQYIGAPSPAVAYDDEGWEISESEARALGSAGVVFTAVQRRIVRTDNGDGTYTLKARYNVSFNHATTTVTDYTFNAFSDYTGEARLAVATANTDVILRNISVDCPIALSDTTVIEGDVNLNELAVYAEGWSQTSVKLYDSEGNEVVLTDGTAQLASGTYTVEYTASAALNNSGKKKNARFASFITVVGGGDNAEG